MKILLIGKSSSGKDFARDFLINKYKLNNIISVTTRPMREGETQRKEYYFISYSKFLEMDYMNEFVEMRSYSTLVDNKSEVWSYGTTYAELLKDNFVGIKCLVGAKAIKKAYPETIVIHIHTDDTIREARARLRGSFDEVEWARRFGADAKDFPENEVTKVCDYFITNNLGELEFKQSLDELMYILLEGKQMNKFKPEHLNQNLVARNNVSYTAQLQLCELYDELEVLLLSSKGELLTRVDYDIISDKVTELEFELQKLWGFPQDKEFHKYWLNIGSCSCPKMDNMDRLGYGRIINLRCPVHGTSQDI